MPSSSGGAGADPSTPKKDRVSTMFTFLPSSLESCGVGLCPCHHLLEERGSALLVLDGKRVMAMAIFLLPSAEICGGGH